MYQYSAPVPAIAEFSQIPAETLRTWQRAENRFAHCAIVNAAYQRSQQDPSVPAVLRSHCDLKTFASALGFSSAYPAGLGVPPTTLRQWEKDGQEFRLRVFLLGSQTLRIQSLLTRVGLSWASNPIEPAQLLRLLLADPVATEKLFMAIHLEKAA